MLYAFEEDGGVEHKKGFRVFKKILFRVKRERG